MRPQETRSPPIADQPSISDLRVFYRHVESVRDSGDSLVIFPQGSVLGVEVAFSAGVVRVARRYGLPVLPIVLSGSHLVCEHPFSTEVRFGQTIDMRVLPPLPADRLDTQTFWELERAMKRITIEDHTAPVRRFVPERDGWWDDYEYEIDPDFDALHARVVAHRLSVSPTEGTEPPRRMSA